MKITLIDTPGGYTIVYANKATRRHAVTSLVRAHLFYFESNENCNEEFSVCREILPSKYNKEKHHRGDIFIRRTTYDLTYRDPTMEIL